MTDLLQKTFRFDFDLEAFEKSDAAPDRSMRIRGIVSTDHLDSQAEVLLQEGLDFGPFLSKGWFNDNHSASTADVLGYPEIAELRDLGNGHKGWYVEGYLIKGHRKAEDIFAMAKSLKGTSRKIGFSVEGSVTDRDPSDTSKVRKAVVRNVAITHCPVNDRTSMEALAKSLSAGTGPAPVNTQITGDGAGAVLAPESLEGVDPKKKKKKTVSRKAARDFYIKKGVPPHLAEHAIDLALKAQEASR
jgi:hypothetical protein